MTDIVRRWQRAAARAEEENVRIIKMGQEYIAASSSRRLRSYSLRQSEDGWTCECKANGEFGMPCKHLSALADVLDLDLFSDIRIAA